MVVLLLWRRLLSSASASAQGREMTLKGRLNQVYRKIHPDLFHQHPKEQVTLSSLSLPLPPDSLSLDLSFFSRLHPVSSLLFPSLLSGLHLLLACCILSLPPSLSHPLEPCVSHSQLDPLLLLPLSPFLLSLSLSSRRLPHSCNSSSSSSFLKLPPEGQRAGLPGAATPAGQPGRRGTRRHPNLLLPLFQQSAALLGAPRRRGSSSSSCSRVCVAATARGGAPAPRGALGGRRAPRPQAAQIQGVRARAAVGLWAAHRGTG